MDPMGEADTVPIPVGSTKVAHASRSIRPGETVVVDLDPTTSDNSLPVVYLAVRPSSLGDRVEVVAYQGATLVEKLGPSTRYAGGLTMLAAEPVKIIAHNKNDAAVELFASLVVEK